MLLQRLATGATGVKQARYTPAHAQYRNTQPFGPWHLLFNAWCNELGRGFCTLVLSLVLHFSAIHFYWVFKALISDF